MLSTQASFSQYFGPDTHISGQGRLSLDNQPGQDLTTSIGIASLRGSLTLADHANLLPLISILFAPSPLQSSPESCIYYVFVTLSTALNSL